MSKSLIETASKLGPYRDDRPGMVLVRAFDEIDCYVCATDSVLSKACAYITKGNRRGVAISGDEAEVLLNLQPEDGLSLLLQIDMVRRAFGPRTPLQALRVKQ